MGTRQDCLIIVNIVNRTGLIKPCYIVWFLVQKHHCNSRQSCHFYHYYIGKAIKSWCPYYVMFYVVDSETLGWLYVYQIHILPEFIRADWGYIVYAECGLTIIGFLLSWCKDLSNLSNSWQWSEIWGMHYLFTEPKSWMTERHLF